MGGPTSAPSLWQQLQAVAQALDSILRGQSGTAAVERVSPALRAGVQALLYAVLRNLGRAQALRGQLAKRPPPTPADALLCSALALAWDPTSAPYEPFTLVNQTIEAAKRGPARAQAAFLNACLRRFLRERDALVAVTNADPVAQWNHPAWWIAQLQKDHPDHWQAILRANNVPGPMTLRINKRKTTLPCYQQQLDAINLVATAVEPAALVLERAVPVERLPGFVQGDVSVQDLAAQMAAPLLLQGLDSGKPLRVLDACAAPGGKTAHLLEYAGRDSPIEVTALEVDPARAQRIEDTLARLGLSAHVVVADAANVGHWWRSPDGGEPPTPFDAILLDAPCTASGIVRRHPDVRWLRRPTDVAQLAREQARLLAALWPLLRPGGRLLYCTCSVFRSEGQEQIQAFVASNTDAQLMPSPGHLLPGGGDKQGAVPDNRQGDHDGFFYALLQKRAP